MLQAWKNWWFVGLCVLCFSVHAVGHAIADVPLRPHLEQHDFGVSTLGNVQKYWWHVQDTSEDWQTGTEDLGWGMTTGGGEVGNAVVINQTNKEFMEDFSSHQAIHIIDSGGTIIQLGCVINQLTNVNGDDLLVLAVAEFPPGGSSVRTVLTASTIRIDENYVEGTRVCAGTVTPSTAAACSTPLSIALDSGSIGISVESATGTDLDDDEDWKMKCWVDIEY